jgi:hypothetical protein
MPDALIAAASAIAAVVALAVIWTEVRSTGRPGVETTDMHVDPPTDGPVHRDLAA